MKLEIADEVLIEGVSRAIQRLFTSETLIERIADAIAKRFELLNPEEAAALLDVTPRTLGENHIKWSLDKSVAFGLTNPKYFLSQIFERAKLKVRKGKQSALKAVA